MDKEKILSEIEEQREEQIEKTLLEHGFENDESVRKRLKLGMSIDQIQCEDEGFKC